MPQTAYLIDTMAYVFRSFFGMRSMSAPDGTPINAVFGLGMTLQKFLSDHQPQMVAWIRLKISCPSSTCAGNSWPGWGSRPS